jgi:hypothetical protein
MYRFCSDQGLPSRLTQPNVTASHSEGSVHVPVQKCPIAIPKFIFKTIRTPIHDSYSYTLCRGLISKAAEAHLETCAFLVILDSRTGL